MDIEEGEIIISDVSSDDTDQGPQPWIRDKVLEPEISSFRQRNRPTTNNLKPSSVRHNCNETSFCRTAFNWKYCLAKDPSARRSKKKKARSDGFSSDSLPRMQNQRIHARQRYSEHYNFNNPRHNHESQRSKKRKYKEKNQSSQSSTQKTEKTLCQLINHCENRSAIINEVIKLSRVQSSAATATHENTPLMQKLIISGLAKPPARSGVPSEIETIVSSSKSESCVKEESISVINIENKDDSDDSEIEVIIPPPKIVPLVTLDSDGEEVEKPGKDCSSSSVLETQNNEVQQESNTISVINNSQASVQSGSLNDNKNDDESLINNVFSDGASSQCNLSELVFDSSDSVGSELAYSPSSPSSFNSIDINITKDQCSESPGHIENMTSKIVHCDENAYTKDTVDNEEISSEVWLNGQQTSINDKEESNCHLHLQSNLRSKNVNKGYPDRTNNNKLGFNNEDSISALVESFIMCSTSFTEDVSTKSKNTCIEEVTPTLQETILEVEPEKSLQRNNEEVVCVFSSKAQNVKNNHQLVNRVVLQHKQSEDIVIEENQPDKEQSKNDHMHDSLGSNETQILSIKNVLSDDQGLSSKSSNYSCEKVLQNDHALVSNSIKPNFNTPKDLTDIIIPGLEQSKSEFSKTSLNLNVIGLENKAENLKASDSIDTATISTVQKHKRKKDKENMDVSNEKYVNKNIEICNAGFDEEDNVSELRMIALKTKGKTTYKETKPDELFEKNMTDVSSSKRVAEQISSENAHQDALEDDDDVLQLRVAALKSAVLKKYGERKKRGLLVKKRMPSVSGRDILTSPDTNFDLDQGSTTPLSPAKSSTTLQGEEDMELAESDFGEDVEDSISAKENNHSISSYRVSSHPEESTPCEISYSTYPTKLPNPSLVVPPQPLPPGVDGDFPELVNQSIFNSILPPPPPPPPPPSLVYSPVLPPPPPPPPLPPFLSSSLESSPQVIQSPLFTNYSNTGCATESLNENPPQEGSSHLNSLTFSNPSCGNIKNSSFSEVELTSNNLSVMSKKAKSLGAIKSPVRGNLVPVPVTKSSMEPASTKNQVRKRKRKRNKSVKALTSETRLLCITKPPGKTSIKFGSSVNTQPVNQTNINPTCVISENNLEDICSAPKDEPPVVLCDTRAPSDSWKDTDITSEYEEIWHRDFPHHGIQSVKSNLCEDNNIGADEIDLSEMIVLDEVGMSPEHKSRNEGSWDNSSPIEEEEDENTLRIRALTSLPRKSVTGISTSEVSSLRLHPQPETYQKGWETRESYISKRGLISPKVKPKEIHNRRVVGIDTSKYKLTRTMKNEQRRSVVHGRVSLKVVVPTNSPPHTPTPELPVPVVKRLVINVNKESDSEEECEWTRKIRIQDTSTTQPLGPVVDDELERSIDELLMRARNNVSYNPPSNQNEDRNPRSPVLKPKNKEISEADLSLQDTPLKLLPKEKQEEYKRLKEILERKERERRLSKQNSLSKAPDKPKPLLHHVLIHENNKQIQKGQNSSDGTEDKREGHVSVQSMNYRVVSNSSQRTRKNSDTETSPGTDHGLDKRYNQKDVFSDSRVKGNRTRKVIYNQPCDLNVDSVEKSSTLAHEICGEGSRFKVPKSTDKYARTMKETSCKNRDTNLNRQQKSLEATDPNIIISGYKLLSSNQQGNENENTAFKDTVIVSCSNKETNLSCPKETQVITTQEADFSILQKNKLLKNPENSIGSKGYERSNKVISKDDSTTNVILDDELSTNNENLSDCCIELDKDKIELKTSETNSLDTNEISIEEVKKVTHLQSASTQIVPLPSHLLSKLEKHEVETHMTSIENSISSEANGGNDEQGRTEPPDVLDEPHLIQQKLHKNDCQEDLSAKKSELLNERFGLLDDLSEMAESLDDLDSHQGRLEQAVVEISDLRRALRAAEDAFRNRVSEATRLECRLHETHNAVVARCNNITLLETTLQNASHEIPTTAQKLMSKKVKQVKEKIDKVKDKRSLIKCLINNPDTTKEEMAKMHATLLMNKTEETRAQVNDEVNSDLWLTDAKTSKMEDFPPINMTVKNRIDSETQTITASGQEVCDLISDLSQPGDQREPSKKPNSTDVVPKKSASSNSNPTLNKCVQSPKENFVQRSTIEEISSTLENLCQQAGERNKTSEHKKDESCKEPCASKRSISQVSDISEAAAKKPNLTGNESMSSEVENVVPNTRLLDDENSDNKHENLGTSKVSRSKLQYKSVLQYKEPSSRVGNPPPSGQPILCPYDLTGRCQDKECKFQHFH